MTAPLVAVLRQVQEEASRRDHNRREAHDGLVQAILAARAASYTYAEIGAAMGTTRQACWELVQRRHQR